MHEFLRKAGWTTLMESTCKPELLYNAGQRRMGFLCAKSDLQAPDNSSASENTTGFSASEFVVLTEEQLPYNYSVGMTSPHK